MLHRPHSGWALEVVKKAEEGHVVLTFQSITILEGASEKELDSTDPQLRPVLGVGHAEVLRGYSRVACRRDHGQFKLWSWIYVMELIERERKASNALHASTRLAFQFQASELCNMPASLIGDQVSSKSAVQLIEPELARELRWFRQPQGSLEVRV